MSKKSQGETEENKTARRLPFTEPSLEEPNASSPAMGHSEDFGVELFEVTQTNPQETPPRRLQDEDEKEAETPAQDSKEKDNNNTPGADMSTFQSPNQINEYLEGSAEKETSDTEEQTEVDQLSKQLRDMLDITGENSDQGILSDLF